MTDKDIDFTDNVTVVPATWLDAMQEVNANAAWDCVLEPSSSTSLRLQDPTTNPANPDASAGPNGGMVINGRICILTAAKTVTLSGSAGTRYIYATNSGSDRDITLVAQTTTSPPSATNWRYLGSVPWTGTAMSGTLVNLLPNQPMFARGLFANRPVVQKSGFVYVATDASGIYPAETAWFNSDGNWIPFSNEDLILSGTLSARPAANVSSGLSYFANDDNFGTLYRSNGTSWVKIAASAYVGGTSLDRAMFARQAVQLSCGMGAHLTTFNTLGLFGNYTTGSTLSTAGTITTSGGGGYSTVQPGTTLGAVAYGKIALPVSGAGPGWIHFGGADFQGAVPRTGAIRAVFGDFDTGGTGRKWICMSGTTSPNGLDTGTAGEDLIGLRFSPAIDTNWKFVCRRGANNLVTVLDTGIAHASYPGWFEMWIQSNRDASGNAGALVGLTLYDQNSGLPLQSYVGVFTSTQVPINRFGGTPNLWFSNENRSAGNNPDFRLVTAEALVMDGRVG